MPVEILEIVVRANVQEQATTANTASANIAARQNNLPQQQIIEEAVEQMLEILRRKEER
jgi:hypothetical protein